MSNEDDDFVSEQHSSMVSLRAQIAAADGYSQYVRDSLRELVLDLMGGEKVISPALCHDKEGLRLHWIVGDKHAIVMIDDNHQIQWSIRDMTTNDYEFATLPADQINLGLGKKAMEYFSFPDEVLSIIELDDNKFDFSEDAPRITVKLKWHLNYWDGPITGICEYEDKRYWFSQVDETEYSRIRLYAVYDIGNEAMSLEEASHDKFRQYVGVHTDYDDEGKRDHGNVKPRESWANYYEWAKVQPERCANYRQCKIIGYFTR